ncbi:helix-turn-helix transcriptional regulator [Acuticoccus sp. M5D2P5]|uniref:winged helix-turn-helix transcriptional regulator n=1 Tax=Acuticoccus kalidii TaxID=2910977 RepID=UPI001F462327|nr:helix-turn-helix domain-containing protein [Acuticoccus kalidii]MCF3935724.1 helix-turn-helix transcriptional regulator [Acuticoccus kalidii]
MKPDPHHSTAACGRVGDLLAKIGSKWTVIVVRALRDRPMRFSELKRAIQDISQKMLTSTLRDLERDGFVTRTVTPTIPPRVDYCLTDLGKDLLVPLDALGDWAVANQHRVDAARARATEAA